MELELWVIVLLGAVFFLTGIMDGISGGGGLITLPAMLLTGMPPEVALGTNKFIAYCGVGASLGSYARSGYVVWKAALTGIPTMALGAVIGAHLVLSLDSEMIGKVIIFLLPLGILATFMPKRDLGSREMRPLDLYFRLPLVCLVLGVYDGFFGPGSGTFMTIALHVVVGFGLIPAVATTKLISMAAGIGGLSIYVMRGTVDFMLVPPLAVCCIAGNIVGSRLAMKVGTGLIRRFLVFSLVLLFASLVWKFWISG